MSDDEKEVKLSYKQQAFVNEYLLDFNATRAARKAGYSEKTAYSIGSRLLKDERISHFVTTRLSPIYVSSKNSSRNKVNKSSYVYLIREDAYGYVKIGISGDPNSRLCQIQVSCPQNIELISVLEVSNAKDVEARLHERYADKHHRGEWFKLSEYDIQDLVTEWKNCQRDTKNSSMNISSVSTQQTLI